MDILYTLGNESKWDNNELRYSLRSLERNCKDIGKVYVIGDYCDWFSDEVIYIPFKETKTKAFNVLDKLLYFFNNYDSKEVLYMMDDVFLTSEINPNGYPFYFKGYLPDVVKNKTTYNNSLIDTRMHLISLGKEYKHFGVHVPIVYDKEKFLSIDWSNFGNYPNGLSIRSVYCNILGVECIYRKDVKIYDINNNRDLRRIIRKSECFSSSDAIIYQGLSQFLEEYFPNKSRFER